MKSFKFNSIILLVIIFATSQLPVKSVIYYFTIEMGRIEFFTPTWLGSVFKVKSQNLLNLREVLLIEQAGQKFKTTHLQGHSCKSPLQVFHLYQFM